MSFFNAKTEEQYKFFRSLAFDQIKANFVHFEGQYKKLNFKFPFCRLVFEVKGRYLQI